MSITFIIKRNINNNRIPYCVKFDDTEEYLLNKLCRITLRIQKKIIKKTKRVIVYTQLGFSLSNGLTPI